MVSGKQNLVAALKAESLRLGFAACGIADLAALPDLRARLGDWIAAGHHGDMDWMARRMDERADPARLWPDLRSAVMLGMSYAPGRDPMALAAAPDAARISVYAQGGDYHKTVKTALKALARWLVDAAGGGDARVFVDTAPVMEKPLAMAAGIGWQGKHTNLVSRTDGSWLFLGALYTSLDLPPDVPGRDRCGSCRACQEICPTGAFPAPYRLDARACISYLTIEHKGPIAHRYRAAMGNHVYGCDDCLAVCPWNKFAAAAQRNQAFLPRAELAAPALADLAALDDAAFRRVFAGSPIKRSGRDRMVRNALIAIGNGGDTALVPLVIARLDDDAAMVRGAAIWALTRLDSQRFAAEHGRRAAAEPDPAVAAEWRGECPIESGLAAF